MAREIISKEALAKEQEPPKAPDPKPDEPTGEIPKTVKFRVSNVCNFNFPDGTSFPFNRPELEIDDPKVIAHLTEISKRAQTSVFIVQ